MYAEFFQAAATMITVCAMSSTVAWSHGMPLLGASSEKDTNHRGKGVGNLQDFCKTLQDSCASYNRRALDLIIIGRTVRNRRK